MLRSDQPTEKKPVLKNEVYGKSKTKKDRSDNSVSNIVTLDNGTMVEVLKFLNYCQLTNSSLVSKTFFKLIQAHRHKLALLSVYSIGMSEVNRNSTGITIFDKVLYLKAYSEWVIYNNYSIEIPLQDQDGSTQSTLYKRKIYGLWANAVYKDSNGSYGIKEVLSASVKLNQGNWPVFQHFVRLLTDPFVYIRRLELIPQIEVSNLLACGANNLDHNRVKCTVLAATLRGNVQTLIKWIKGHVRCDSFRIEIYTNSNYDEELLDVFMNGAKCTSEINLKNYDLCKVVIVFVQKFMDVKSGNENQPVETTRGIISNLHVEEVKRCYAKFIVKEERNEDDESIEQVFEFVNSDMGKKLELKIRIILHYWKSEFSTKIANL